MFYSCAALKRKQARLFCCPGLHAALPLCSTAVETGIGERGRSGNWEEGPESSPPCGTRCSAAGATAPPARAHAARAGWAPEMAIAFPILRVYRARWPGCFASPAGSAQDQRSVPPPPLRSRARSRGPRRGRGTVPCSQPGSQRREKVTCKQSGNRGVSLSLALIVSN